MWLIRLAYVIYLDKIILISRLTIYIILTVIGRAGGASTDLCGCSSNVSGVGTKSGIYTRDAQPSVFFPEKVILGTAPLN